MKNKKLLVLVITLALFSSLKASAQDICSKDGYTILTINGIFTDEKGALLNKGKLKQNLPPSYKNEKILVDYIYNATHLAGAWDLVDAVRQGLFDSGADYDLTEMLDSASDKVTTQKLLLVGHSQGNFYANDFYDKVTDKLGGVPAQSIGVYGVATPDDHVAGGGKYLTSDTDNVISAVVGRLKNIMKPNTHIELQKGDGGGHSFSDVYLKYRSAKIVSDIKASFDNLDVNTIQGTAVPCISPQKISILHEINGMVLAVADFTINTGIKISSFAYNTVNKTGAFMAGTLVNIAKSGLAAVGLADNKNSLPIIAEAIEEDVSIGEIVVPIEPDLPVEENIETPSDILPTEVTETDTSTGSTHNSGTNNEEIIPEVAIPVIVADILAPVITLNGENIINVPLEEEYTELGATALDEKDGAIIVATSGIVDNKILGMYVITYSATDTALNTNTMVRIVNIIDRPIITPPVLDDKDDDNAVDTIPPVITLLDGSPLYLATDKDWPYVESGATALDEKDGNVEVIISGKIDRDMRTIQTLTYTATDKAGNISTKTREVKFSDRVYIAKNTFGTGNGDGRDWQLWSFNGSSVYGWSDTYVNKYLHEQFKIESQADYMWCSACLMRGIFKDDPRKGFGVWDFEISALESSPQSSHTGYIYDVSIQWDKEGYRTIISHNGIIDTNVHINVTGMNNDLWVGWDPMTNGFKTFPTGYWHGVNGSSRSGLEGGTDLTLTPFPIYDENAENTTPPTPPVVTPILSPEKIMKSFTLDSIQLNVVGIIDETNHTVSLMVPFGVNVNNLSSSIIISDKATVLPSSATLHNFTNPVNFVITAEDGSTQEYVATVTILPEIVIEDPIVPPIEEDDTNTILTIGDYRLNGGQTDVSTNPIINNVTIDLIASKKVNWMSLKIEKEDNPSIYKMFQSNSTTCADWTKTCSKTWVGDLSSGGLLQNGVYKMKLHMKDILGNDYDHYLNLFITVTGQ